MTTTSCLATCNRLELGTVLNFFVLKKITVLING